MKSKKMRLLFSSLLILSMLFSLSILSGAETTITQPAGIIELSEDNAVEPLYDKIHRVEMYANYDGVTAVIETTEDYSMTAKETVYKENGSGWSFVAKKTFSDYGAILIGTVNCNFEPGVTYKAVAEFNVDGERETMEDYYTF